MFRSAVAAVAVGGGLIFSGADAQACSECLVSALNSTQPKPAPRATAQRAAKAAHKPVATAAGRVIKTERGHYANASPSRPATRRVERVQYLPVVVATEAEHAFAMTQAFASPSISVRTVAADEVNEIDLAANDSPIKPVLVPTRVESAFAMMNAKAPNATDSRMPAQASAPPVTAGCDGANASARRDDSWLERMGAIVGHAYEAVVATISP